MLYLDANQTIRALPWLELIDALQDGFATGCEAPIRHQHSFKIPNEQDGSLLLMPAWISDSFLGVKQVLVVPDNGKRSLPAVNASYQLSCAKTGKLLAIIDGETLTNRRTAAASALASRYLSKPDAEHLLMVGTGGLARTLIPAHCSIRPIKQVSIWGRNLQSAKELADEISNLGFNAHAVEDLAECAGSADIISCATLAREPLVRSEQIKPGTHIDLVGAFTPQMRESDTDLIARAKVFVDTRDGAEHEAGDLILASDEGMFDFLDIQASLRELATAKCDGRVSDDEITVFKSVGTALEDLYAAILAFENGKTND